MCFDKHFTVCFISYGTACNIAASLHVKSGGSTFSPIKLTVSEVCLNAFGKFCTSSCQGGGYDVVML